jgi:hypothetical protein
MEKLFLECLDEVKKEASKRKENQEANGLYQTKSWKKINLAPKANERYEELAKKTPQPKK